MQTLVESYGQHMLQMIGYIHMLGWGEGKSLKLLMVFKLKHRIKMLFNHQQVSHATQETGEEIK